MTSLPTIEDDDASSNASHTPTCTPNDDKQHAARSLFDLPPDEELVLDVFCMKRQSGLYMPGRLYLFSHNVGFHSQMWGNTVNRRVAIDTLNAVYKKRHVGTNRTITIVFGNNKRSYDFHNVTDRGKMYECIMTQWRKVNPSAVEHFQRQQTAETVLKGPSRLNQLLPIRSKGRSPGAQRDTMSNTASGSVELDDSDDTDSDEGEELKLDENAIEALATIAEDPELLAGQAPPIPDDWVRIGGLTVPALSRQVVAKLFLSDFMKHYQESVDGRNIVLTAWNESNLGLVRTMTFTMSNKMPIGPADIQCHQYQRLSVFETESFLVQTEQFQLNIPFADCFSVEGRFDVRPSSLKPQHADIDLHVHVAFKKNTIMRGKIESNTLATHQKNFGTLEEAIRKAFAPRGAGQASAADPLQPLIDKLPPQLREEAAALLAVLLPNSANAKHMSKECSKALEAARQLLVLPPYYAAPRPKMHIDPTITFSIVIAGSVLLLILLVLMLVMPVLSNSLYGPGEQLMEGRGVQPVVIPPEFWTSMLEFHKELQVLRAQNKGG